MEIINAHVHMIEPAGLTDDDINLVKDIPVFDDIENMVYMLSTEELFWQMGEAGITKSVLFAVDAPLIYASNEYVRDLCDKYPKRLMGFASVNPVGRDIYEACDILEVAINDYDLKGLKFHPPLQNFFPNDEKIFPLYKAAEDLDIPVVFHVGSTPFGSCCKLSQANPLLIDDVAVQFPNLRIMLTHLGTLWHNEAFMVVEKNKNVFIDTSAYLYEIESLLTSDLLNRIGSHKVIFGTDYPTPFGGKPHNMNSFVYCLRRLGLKKDILEGIFCYNFYHLLDGMS